MKWIVIQVADHEAEDIEFNEKHGNAQAIVSAGDGIGFEVIAVVEPGSIEVGE